MRHIHIPSKAPRGLLPFLPLLLACPLLAGTLETRFTTVVLEDVPLGSPAAVRLADGGYYGVRNASERPVGVRFAAAVPEYCQPTTNGVRYLPIADARWVRVEPSAVTVPPNAEAEALVTVTVPNDPAFLGKNYEFWLRARVMQGQGGVSLLSRVRFNTVAADRLPPPPETKPRPPGIHPPPGAKPKRSFWSRLW